MTAALQLRIRGQVTACECRTTTAGAPLLVLHLKDASGQEVRALHSYPDASASSHYAASSLARNLRGQHAELEVTNPRFKSRRLDCDAALIHIPSLTRSDQQ